MISQVASSRKVTRFSSRNIVFGRSKGDPGCKELPVRHQGSIDCFLVCLIAVASIVVEFCVAGAGVGGLAQAQDPSPVTTTLRADVEYLASDELKGRGTDSESIDIAADYVARRMKEAGLDTGTIHGKPFQPLAISFDSKVGSAEDNSLSFSITHSGAGSGPSSVTLFRASLGAQMNPMAVGTVTGKVSGPLVFVGYGITAKQHGYDDYQGIDVKDKVVIVLRKEPPRLKSKKSDDASPAKLHQGTRHAFFAMKIRNAIDHGAAAVLLVNDAASIKMNLGRQTDRIHHEINRRRDLQQKIIKLPAEATNNRKAFTESIHRIGQMIEALEQEKIAISQGLMSITEAGASSTVYSKKDARKHKLIPVVSITRSLLDQLLNSCRACRVDPVGCSIDSCETAINQTTTPHSFPLENVTVDLESRLTPSSRESSNVIGVLDGKGDLANETVVIGAHYDHVGMGRFGSLAPNTIAIHNGADDNASGTAVLLATAKHLVHRLREVPRHRRLVVIAFTGEEVGLLGSKFYVRHPRFPLESTVAMINMDMVGRLREDKLTVYGTGSAKSFDALIESANVNLGFRLEKIQTGYGPSDQQPFVQLGIPVLFFFTGLHSDYHRPTDDFSKIDFGGMTRITDIVCECSFQLAVRLERPQYTGKEQ